MTSARSQIQNQTPTKTLVSRVTRGHAQPGLGVTVIAVTRSTRRCQRRRTLAKLRIFGPSSVEIFRRSRPTRNDVPEVSVRKRSNIKASHHKPIFGVSRACVSFCIPSLAIFVHPISMKLFLPLAALLGASSAFTAPKFTSHASSTTAIASMNTWETGSLLSGAGEGPGNTDWMIDNIGPVARIEGQTRNTWDFPDLTRDTVQFAIESNGRPVNAEIQLWIGPDWTPFTLKAYSEDGGTRPVQALLGTRNKAAQVEIRNTASYEFPLSAAASYAKPPLSEIRTKIPETAKGEYIEGGAIESFTFGGDADQVQVFLKTETRQLNVYIELLNGPNNPKQTFEVFTNNGMLNSLYVVFNTMSSPTTVRIHNIAPVEFPCRAYVSKV